MAFNQGFVDGSGHDVRSPAYEIADAYSYGELDLSIPYFDLQSGRVFYNNVIMDMQKSGGGYPSFNPADDAFRIIAHHWDIVQSNPVWFKHIKPEALDIVPIVGGDQKDFAPDNVSWNFVELAFDRVSPETNHWYDSAEFGKFGFFAGLNATAEPILPVTWINFNPCWIGADDSLFWLGYQLYVPPGTIGTATFYRTNPIPNIWYQIEGGGWNEYVPTKAVTPTF